MVIKVQQQQQTLQASDPVTYIDSTKQIKGVRVGEGGFLSGLPVFCDKGHGLHGEL